MITLKKLDQVSDAKDFQMLARIVWGIPENSSDNVPMHVIMTVVKNGGMLIGAYDKAGPTELNKMIGAAFWWLGFGLTTHSEPAIKACSHMVCVHPNWQHKNVGTMLKLYQKELVYQQGVAKGISWTFDPLSKPNGIFNFSKLGATCNRYYQNVYGEMDNALNGGDPTDRCEVDWQLNGLHTLQALDRPRDKLSLGGEPTVIRFTGDKKFEDQLNHELHRPNRNLAIPIPDKFSDLRKSNPVMASEWRHFMRTTLEELFKRKYTIVDAADIPTCGWCYMLTETPD